MVAARTPIGRPLRERDVRRRVGARVAHQRFYFSRYDRERRQRNRIHLDITPFAGRRATRAEVEAESARLVALGATVEKVLDGSWGPYEEFAIMMRDPERNEFCVQ